MAAYLVGAIDIHDPEEYARYRAGVGAALAGFDVEILSTDGHPKVVEGAQPAAHLFIIKFLSVEQFDAFYASANYQRIIRHRHAGSTAAFLMAMRGP